MKTSQLNRRAFVKSATLAGAYAATARFLNGALAFAAPAREKTNFQIACMTLPYSRFPLHRALTGIRDAGYRYVAWGTTHREEDGKQVPVMAPDAPPERAKELAARCRDLGLEPLMMFSTVYPEAKNAMEVFTSRIRQAAAARLPQVLTFGHTEGSHRAVWVERFKKLCPIARDHATRRGSSLKNQ